ncbi:TPA: hypothetical protein DIT23_02550 [candidate division WOR-3 bacterium]|nr:hypothetical protein [candidate division WOR-3 bacterium]
MKRKVLLLSFILILLLFSVYFTYLKYQSRTVFSLDEKKVSFDYILRYKEFYKRVNSIDKVLDCDVVDETIKDIVFFKIAKDEGLDVSDKSINFYFNIHKSDLNLDFESLKNSFTEKEIFDFLKRPFVVKNLLIEKIKFDSNFIQRERYLHSKKIFKEWNGKSVEKSFLNEFTEYIEQHIDENDSAFDFKTGEKNFYEDDGFYYVFLANSDALFGYRVYKVPSDEYIKSKYFKRFKLKFYDEKNRREFLLTNRDKLLYNLVEVK